MNAPPLAATGRLGDTADVAHGLLAFVGRTAELAMLREAIAAARSGRGGLWFLSGVAGIGKSRLVEEIARDADQAGFSVLWGRCWEAGGAPAFWPWIQIVREALRIAEAAMLEGGRAAHLVQLVPELRDRVEGLSEPPPLAGDNAQFMLLDAVASALCAAARKQPLFIALEDLHVASPSSLLLLDLLAQQARGVPLLILGTFRDTELRTGDTERLLQRAAQNGRTLALAPLPRDAIEQFIGNATGKLPSPQLVATIVERTEGNPLFLVELCRLMVARVASDVPTDVVPPTLRSALQRHLAGLSHDAREILEHAAVLGRDFAPARVVAAFGLPTERVHAAIAEAERSTVLARTADGGYRFTHILLREVLHQELPTARRQALHLAAARWLETYAVERAALPWSEIAHHYLAAGDDAREAAIDAMERAAQQAAATFAFAEAIASYRAALQAVDLLPVRATRRRAELMIGLGRAQLHGQDAQTGRDTCLAAAALARELDAPDLLARAALELGSVLTLSTVDTMLVALLEEALRALGTTHDRLRARVMSRLAAAKQPNENPREPIALALEAVALARTTDDPRTLLATLSCASSTMVDNVEACDRVPIDREHVALASTLGDRAEQLRGQLRLALALFEIGDLTGAQAAADAAQQLCARLDHPFYRWHGSALAAMLALWEGRFAEAEREIERAEQLGLAGGDPNVTATVTYQRTRLARLTGRRDLLRTGIMRLCQLFAGTPIGESLVRAQAAGNSLQLGSGAAMPMPNDAELELARRDRASLECAAELAAVHDDAAFAARLLDQLSTDRSRCFTSGVIGMTWDGPLARLRAILHHRLGQLDAAIAAMTDAVTTCRELGGRPLVAWCAHELASYHLERGSAEDRAIAAELLGEADALASELGMRSVTERIAQARQSVTAPAATRPAAQARQSVTAPAAARPAAALAFSLVRSGDTWTVAHGGHTFQLRDTKGLRYLARLVEEPRRELHVLDLGDAPDGVDAGDAGELLDPKAREQYRQRVRALDEELADAEARNDLGAAERARQELEFLQAELGRAVGLGGRARRAGSATERARVNVQRRLRTAMAQIAAHDAVLARHLERSIRTGVFCCYEPD